MRSQRRHHHLADLFRRGAFLIKFEHALSPFQYHLTIQISSRISYQRLDESVAHWSAGEINPSAADLNGRDIPFVQFHVERAGNTIRREVADIDTRKLQFLPKTTLFPQKYVYNYRVVDLFHRASVVLWIWGKLYS